MTTEADLSLLRKFFSTYFNEDWDCDSENSEGIVRRFIAVATPEERTVLAEAIVKYAAGFGSDKELEKHLFRELGCYSMPSGVGISCKAWLEHIAEELR
jgi:CdiI immunity protein